MCGPGLTTNQVTAVAPGVYRIPVPIADSPVGSVNVYALEDRASITLIDAGWDSSDAWDALRRGLARIGSSPAAVTRVVVTHLHYDHYGLAMRLREAVGAQIVLGEGEAANMVAVASAQDDFPPSLAARVRTAGGQEYLDPALWRENRGERDWEAPDAWLADGDGLDVGSRRLVAHHTPGHTAGHVVLHDPAEDLLFSGDHILPSTAPALGFEPVPPRGALADYLASLRKVAGLDDARLLPAHGAVGGSVHQRVARLTDQRMVRVHAVRGVLGVEGSTAAECAAQLSWSRSGRRIDELRRFDRMLAVLEVLACLEFLEGVGEAERRAGDVGDRFTIA